ncbi:desiccation protectant protein Lea14 homolog [Panicum virgatum]|uniref:desiccation protectant protein Lea14 homolog n=1 Tax=Panicum virgatum TaxID=38727 RepID=UPI0019D6324E|nr:desiccation protectant protein Lea14 homolog [Panicum virgatum]
MSSSKNPTVTECGSKDGRDEDGDKKEGGGGCSGFIDKVKDFIHDISEKIEEAFGFGKPSADVSGIHIPHISLHRANLVIDVLIKNPNPIPIPLVDIDYLIDNGGRKLVSGLIPDAGTIHAHGEETVKIPWRTTSARCGEGRRMSLNQLLQSVGGRQVQEHGTIGLQT